MNYYATLKLGRIYKVNRFYERGVEVAVSFEEAEYLKTLGEKQLSPEGNNMTVVTIPRFSIREEKQSTEERVLEEILSAPNNIAPKKPGPKPKEASEN